MHSKRPTSISDDGSGTNCTKGFDASLKHFFVQSTKVEENPERLGILLCLPRRSVERLMTKIP